jgi:hypothetical protein
MGCEVVNWVRMNKVNKSSDSIKGGKLFQCFILGSRFSSVSAGTRLQAGRSISNRDKDRLFFLPGTASRPGAAHSTFYPVGVGDSYPGGKAAGACI